MLIGVDARGTEDGFKNHFGRGTGRYAENLIENLKTHAPERILPIYQKDFCGPKIKDLLKLSPVAKNTIESQLIAPYKLSKLKLSGIHFLSQTDTVNRAPVPYIVSVLDLIPLKFPDLYSGSGVKGIRYKFARYLENLGLKNAKGFIAISEATKKDLIAILNISPDKIEVTHLGLEEKFIQSENNPHLRALKRYEARNELRLDHDFLYLIYVGGIDPRKNINFLLEVLAELKISISKIKLIMVGNLPREKEYDKFKAKVFDLRLNSNIIETGFITDEQLLKYYHSADLMIFPSLYEGFGFPVLEASSMGVPVICNKNSSLPEILGEAGEMIDNFKVEDWCRTAISILFNSDHAKDLIDKGAIRSQQFTWHATAAATIKAYEKFFA